MRAAPLGELRVSRSGASRAGVVSESGGFLRVCLRAAAVSELSVRFFASEGSALEVKLRGAFWGAGEWEGDSLS